tara:strand:- start:1349 stop:1687 length:339 start_codon:yes stop_codon:yes gene_type:complete
MWRRIAQRAQGFSTLSRNFNGKFFKNPQTLSDNSLIRNYFGIVAASTGIGSIWGVRQYLDGKQDLLDGVYVGSSVGFFLSGLSPILIPLAVVNSPFIYFMWQTQKIKNSKIN